MVTANLGQMCYLISWVPSGQVIWHWGNSMPIRVMISIGNINGYLSSNCNADYYLE